jgi:hypothetical protein
VPGAIQHERRVTRGCRGADFDDVKSLIAQVHHRSPSETARLRRIEHLNAYPWRVRPLANIVAMSRAAARRQCRRRGGQRDEGAYQGKRDRLASHRIVFHS